MKTLKFIFLLIFSSVTFNLYSVNICHENLKIKKDSTLIVNQSDTNNIIEKSQIKFDEKTSNPQLNFAITLLILSVIGIFLFPLSLLVFIPALILIFSKKTEKNAKSERIKKLSKLSLISGFIQILVVILVFLFFMGGGA
jgi:hypothetical protein